MFNSHTDWHGPRSDESCHRVGAGICGIERLDDKRIEATAVAAGLLWQSTNRAGAVDALISLLGPAESIEIASADHC